jgi:hypothetical protein
MSWGLKRGDCLSRRPPGVGEVVRTARIEPQTQGRQIAWVRRSNGGWLAVVLVPAASGNGRSSLTIPLWLDPSLVTTDPQS